MDTARRLEVHGAVQGVGLRIAERPEATFTSFGDMLRVPGSSTDLLALKARGADVRVVLPHRRGSHRPARIC